MKIYTNVDWEEAVRKAEVADAVVAAIVEKQAERRKRIAAENEILDTELDGPISKRLVAWDAKTKLQNRLLGPWIIDRARRWGSATIYRRGLEEYVARGVEKDPWSRRGWLRVWLKDAPVWRFDYGGYTSVCRSGNVLLGPPTDEPGDFEARLEEASNLLVKAGFILP